MYIHSSTSSFFLLLILLILSPLFTVSRVHSLSIKEATIDQIQLAFNSKQLTSRQFVEFYLEKIRELNPILKGVIEVNPDALSQAQKADQERGAKAPGSLAALHGIPVLLKDSIATKDKLNTTSGSFALLGSVVPEDAGVVKKLRKAGAIIFGKASLSEWNNARSARAPSGWSARGGQGKNPYVLSATPCGSSSGSAISVAANMVAVSLGTETGGSILCPASFNSVVGIKPTGGLTSRAGVVPITPRQDTIGPICRTISDAVHVLECIVGFDKNDAEATKRASKYIPQGGYKQFLKLDGIKGKRLGILRNPLLFEFTEESTRSKTFKEHIQTLREKGAIIFDHLEIPNIEIVTNGSLSGGDIAMFAEFKLSLNAYLRELKASPVHSLADVIAFNQNHSELEMTKEFRQDMMIVSEATNGIKYSEKAAIKNIARLCREGFEKVMGDRKLDALVTYDLLITTVLAIGGYPGINVPAGYSSEGIPFGINFGGLKGSEPKLIEIAYGFEQATKVRKPPSFP